jgi:serine protease Do
MSLRPGLTLTFLASAALATIFSATIPAAPAWAQEDGAIEPGQLSHPLPDFQALVRKVKPAVVSITSVMHEEENQPQLPPGFGQGNPFGIPGFPFGQLQPQHRGPIEARGSGFIIDPDGTVVTNNHVVKGATKVTVTLDDGTTYPAKVLGRDSRSDLAVLQITPKKRLAYIALGDSDLAQPGAWVVAVGNPFGLGGSVTAGIVSARGRDIGEGPYDSFIQVDAAINQGNSGGPLFTQDGKVVGVNTAIISPSGGSVGIGFAIPSNTVKTVVAQLKKNGHVTRGYIGVETQAISAAISGALKLPDSGNEDRGALVASVEPDSPAAKAGVQPGDVVLSVNGKNIGSPRELAIAIAAITPGDEASLAVMRNGEHQNIDVKVGTLSADLATAGPNGTGSAPGLGVALSPITPELRQQLNLPEHQRGAVITEIKPGSPAETAGLQQGDVIIAVGDQPVSTPAEASREVHAALSANQAVALRILRNGEPLFVGVQLGTGSDQGNNDDDQDK